LTGQGTRVGRNAPSIIIEKANGIHPIAYASYFLPTADGFSAHLEKKPFSSGTQ
jgi:hypothetical protein